MGFIFGKEYGLPEEEDIKNRKMDGPGCSAKNCKISKTYLIMMIDDAEVMMMQLMRMRGRFKVVDVRTQNEGRLTEGEGRPMGRVCWPGEEGNRSL